MIYPACGEAVKASTINKSNAQHAILFEAISLILALDCSRDLLNSSVTALGKFLSVKVGCGSCWRGGGYGAGPCSAAHRTSLAVAVCAAVQVMLPSQLHWICQHIQWHLESFDCCCCKHGLPSNRQQQQVSAAHCSLGHTDGLVMHDCQEPNIRYLALENLTRLALVPEVLESIQAHQLGSSAN